MKKLLFTGILLGLTHLAAGQDWKEKRSLGEQYLGLGDYAKARTLLREAYDLQRNNNTYQSLYHICMVQEDHEAAAKLARDFAKWTNQLRYAVDQASALEAAGDQKQADRVWEEIDKNVRKKPEQALGIAGKYVELQRFGDGLRMYRIAQEANPKMNLHYQVADIYSAMGRIDLMYAEYLLLVEKDPVYLTSVRNILSRSVSTDPENENNIMLRQALIQKIQETSQPAYSDLLSWVYVQERNFDAAVRQAIALDRRLRGNQSEVYQLAQVCETNEAYEAAIKCYDYIIEDAGVDGPFYRVAEIGRLRVFQARLNRNNQYTEEDVLELKSAYVKTIGEFGKSEYTVTLLRDLAHLEAFFLKNADEAQNILEQALEYTNARPFDLAGVKLELADILLLSGWEWDAILLYGQVEKDFSEDIIGQEAKFRRARISYYQGDFQWAQAQLDVLKASTSKLIANDAMNLSLLISDNLNLDTTGEALETFARAELLAYQQQYEEALMVLEQMEQSFGGHSLIDEVIYRRARICFELRHWDRAAAAYQKIIDSYGFDLLGDDACYHLAQLYDLQLNDPGKAFELYGKMLTTYPGSSYTVQARKRYREMRGDNPDL